MNDSSNSNTFDLNELFRTCNHKGPFSMTINRQEIITSFLSSGHLATSDSQRKLFTNSCEFHNFQFQAAEHGIMRLITRNSE